MKRKLLALLLVFTMLGVSVFAGISTSAADDDNLLSHLNNLTTTSKLTQVWTYHIVKDNASHLDMTVSGVKDATINSKTVKTVRFLYKTDPNDATDKSVFIYDAKNSAKIEKNHKYTTTFWVRSANAANLTIAMYTKPTKTGTDKYTGANAYTSDSIRSDVEHTWVANYANSTSKVLQKTKSSVLNTSSTALAENEGDWVQIVHTFETGGTSDYEAFATYHIESSVTAGTDIQVADFNMVAEEVEGAVTYTPAVNDEKLGAVSKEILLVEGQEAEITAEPFGDNVFDGWYVGEELVSTDLTYKFMYLAANPPAYEARFTAGPSVTNGHYEDATADTVAKLPTNVGALNWTDGSFLASSKDNIHYEDDLEGGINWRQVSVSTDKAHTGSKSLKLFGGNAAAGRKLTGLNPNSKYVASVYAYIEYTGTGTNPILSKAIVTTTDKSAFKKPGTSLTVKEASDDGVLGYANTATLDANGKWQKIEVEFITGNFTEVILWTYVYGGSNKVNLYLDNYALKQVPLTFKAQSNATAFGTVTHAEEMVVNAGQEITVEATPATPYNEFEGWFAGSTRVSTDKVFTFNYVAEYAVLTAKFKSYGGGLANHSMEEYTDGQVLATFDAPSVDKDPEYTSTSPWRLDSTYRYNPNDLDTGSKKNILKVTTAKALTGDKSVVHNIPFRYIAYDLKGLKANTDYVFSFFAHITGNDDSSEKTVNKIYAVPTSQDLIVFYNDKYLVNEGVTIAKAPDKVDCFNKWEKAEIKFNTKGNTDVTIWISYEGTGANLYIDDLCIYEPVKANFSAGLGGEVSANIENGNIIPGTNVKLTATPLEGNTFAGWSDVTGKIVSTDAVFEFVANESFSYIANFEGPNKPVVDLFATQGIDGTFESHPVNFKFPGWSAHHKTDSSSWATFKVSEALAYEGEHSLQVNSRFRTTKFVMSGLSPDTDYRLSFYVNAPDPNPSFSLNNFYITDTAPNLEDEIAATFVTLGKLKANSGWNKVDMYFNSSTNTELALMFSYVSDVSNGIESSVFFDNFHLYTYEANDELANGGFEDGKNGWIGDGTVVADNGNNVLQLAEGETAYTNLGLKDYTVYNVSFKAKGNGTSAVLDLPETEVNVKNYLSSVSYVDAKGETWTEYSYKIYSGPHKAVKLAFKGGENGLFVDDVKVEETSEASAAVIEKIDFESERFALTGNYDGAYTIYSGDQANVYAGSNSLKFTYSDVNLAIAQLLDEGFLSYQSKIGVNLKISFKLKVPSSRDGGAVALAPDYSETVGADTGFQHFSTTKDWQDISFYVANREFATLKLKLASIANITTGDFYIDDIVISLLPPMVLEEDTKTNYCEDLYNSIENPSFESEVNENNWANLPSTVQVVKGDARKGSYFLRATAGAKYVLPIKVQANKKYTFGASVRGDANTVGGIGIALNKEGTDFFINREGAKGSLISFDTKKSGWDRSGFTFTTDTSGIAYLVIDVKSGALDVDSVMLFATDAVYGAITYGYRYDPNDYTVYTSYDYDNLESATTVINGGFGKQPYYTGEGIVVDPDVETEEDADASTVPTGDSLAVPAICIVVAFLASAVLVLMRKRKEGAENA